MWRTLGPLLSIACWLWSPQLNLVFHAAAKFKKSWLMNFEPFLLSFSAGLLKFSGEGDWFSFHLQAKCFDLNICIRKNWKTFPNMVKPGLCNCCDDVIWCFKLLFTLSGILSWAIMFKTSLFWPSGRKWRSWQIITITMLAMLRLTLFSLIPLHMVYE